MKISLNRFESYYSIIIQIRAFVNGTFRISKYGISLDHFHEIAAPAIDIKPEFGGILF